jgi:galactitol-specific phosphotransferase system IIB component
MDNKNNLTITELVDKVNTFLSRYSIKYKDSRIQSFVTIRRVRDYIGKGILENGDLIGKNIMFSDEHVNKLLQIRKFQGIGYSDKMIKSTLNNKNLKLILKENKIDYTILEDGTIIISNNIFDKNKIIDQLNNL